MPTRINCSSFGHNAACTHPEAPRQWFSTPRCIVWLDSVGTPADPRRPRGHCTLCTPFLRPPVPQPMPFYPGTSITEAEIPY